MQTVNYTYKDINISSLTLNISHGIKLFQ